jgi:TonB family protein
MAERKYDIEKYHRGELSPSEMNQIEREALKDPFLADALDGSGQLHPNEFSADVKALNKRLLKKRNKSVFSLRVAASVSLLLAIGGLWWLLWPDQSSMLVENVPPKVIDTVQTQVEYDTNKIATRAESKILSTNGSRDSRLSNSSKKNPTLTQAEEPIPNIRIDSAETMLADAVKKEPVTLTPQVSSNPPTDLNGDKEKVIPEAQLPEKTEKKVKEYLRTDLVADKRVIAGRVTDDEGNSLPGVNVLIPGTTSGTVTDSNGQYTIEVGPSFSHLMYSFIGFVSQKVALENRSEVNVQLTADVSQLSEVVVTGYGYTTPSDREPVVRLAEPVGGRRAYNKYLDANVQYPEEAKAQNVKGRVTLQFTVHTDGSLDEFNILKGLGYGCDEEVIRLVKEGPKWNPTTEDNVPVESEVRVRVKFPPPDK